MATFVITAHLDETGKRLKNGHPGVVFAPDRDLAASGLKDKGWDVKPDQLTQVPVEKAFTYLPDVLPDMSLEDKYQELIGCLIYLAGLTHPDVAAKDVKREVHEAALKALRQVGLNLAASK